MRRRTIDIVILGLTALVRLVVAVEVIGSILIVLFRPEVDIEPIFTAMTEVIVVIVGALIGFIGGRSVGRHEREDESS